MSSAKLTPKEEQEAEELSNDMEMFKFQFFLKFFMHKNYVIDSYNYVPVQDLIDMPESDPMVEDFIDDFVRLDILAYWKDMRKIDPITKEPNPNYGRGYVRRIDSNAFRFIEWQIMTLKLTKTRRIYLEKEDLLKTEDSAPLKQA